jgi:hypothetical protein
VYSERIVAKRLDAMCAAFGLKTVKEHAPGEIDEWTKRLSDARGPKGEVLRDLAQEEQAFVRNELVFTKCSYRYWAERYSYCSKQGAGITRMFPLMDSQSAILGEMGRVEDAAAEREDEGAGGIMVNVLKARRLGASTLAQSLVTHRLTTQTYLDAICASDVPEQSSYTIQMHRLMMSKLPWWLKPGLQSFKNTYPQTYDYRNGSRYWCHAGVSNRGVEGDRGQMGRGKGISVCHLTELSTWEDTDQIDSALLPTMTPPHSRVLAIFESSPKGRSNWWHEHWETCVQGLGYFAPIFLPWYAEPKKYRRAVPEGWRPLPSTVAHARRCEEQAPRWIHRPAALTKEQLFWYESSRAYYERKDKLGDFLQEYAADPDECFVFSGKSLFPLDVIQRVEDQRKPLMAALEVMPLMDMRGQA